MPRRDESTFRAHGLEGSQDAVSSGDEHRPFEDVAGLDSRLRLAEERKVAYWSRHPLGWPYTRVQAS